MADDPHRGDDSFEEEEEIDETVRGHPYLPQYLLRYQYDDFN